eukprot:573135-Pelagomonas_calceolata.AAC.6
MMHVHASSHTPDVPQRCTPQHQRAVRGPEAGCRHGAVALVQQARGAQQSGAASRQRLLKESIIGKDVIWGAQQAGAAGKMRLLCVCVCKWGIVQSTNCNRTSLPRGCAARWSWLKTNLTAPMNVYLKREQLAVRAHVPDGGLPGTAVALTRGGHEHSNSL